MTVYFIKQDNTIWGCGDPECCGEYIEEIDDIYIECNCRDIEVTPEHLVTYVGGGPVLEWRKATALESKIFGNGYSQGWTDGSDNGFEWGSKNTRENIIKLLKKSDSVCVDWAIAIVEGKNES